MSDSLSPRAPEDVLAPVRQDAGALLRAARESHGLSIEVVAQHLKLAPRQVRALETGDASQLPGRTFIRGFARNYARLMQLDPDAIVAALPAADPANASEAPTSTVTARPIGELPDAHPRERSTWSRPVLLLVLAALAGIAAYFELARQRAAAPAEKAAAARMPVDVPGDPIGPSTAYSLPLPNPLTGETVAGVPASATVSSTESPGTGVPPASPATLPIDPASVSVAAAGAPVAAQEATLLIRYTGASWTEVRDASGQRLLVSPGAPGASETVRGTPPFELTLGNASNASVSWRGAAFDLTPHVKGNVARVRLP